jgi:hypothetical protein
VKRALLVLALAACSKDNFLDLHLVEPAGQDPLAQAASIKISAGAHMQTVPVTGGHYNVSFTLQTSNPAELQPVEVQAFASDGVTMVAHGKTPVIQLAPSNGGLYVYVASPGSLGSPLASDGVSPTKIGARTRHAAAYYPGLGVFVGGGLDSTMQPTNTVALWFHYELTESTSALWALGQARSDLAGAFDGSLLDFLGGTDASGVTSSVAEILDPTGSIGLPEARTIVAAGQANGARTHAAAAMGSEGFLVFGGRGTDGMPQAGAVLFTPNDGDKALLWPNAVARVGATATAILNGAQIIVFGGGPAGKPVMEKYVSQTSAVAVMPDPTTNRTEHAAVVLPNGSILFTGGKDDSGAPLASATVYDPVAGTAMELPGFLQTARFGHTATLAGTDIVIAGGETGSGVAGTAEAFDAMTLAPRGGPIPMTVPRKHHTATDPGNDSVVILGGEDENGVPTGVVEIYQP